MSRRGLQYRLRVGAVVNRARWQRTRHRLKLEQGRRKIREAEEHERAMERAVSDIRWARLDAQMHSGASLLMFGGDKAKIREALEESKESYRRSVEREQEALAPFDEKDRRRILREVEREEREMEERLEHKRCCR